MSFDLDHKLALDIIRHRQGQLDKVRALVQKEWYEFIEIAPTTVLVEWLPNMAFATGQAESDPYMGEVNKLLAGQEK
jgi:hypothetical protein